MNDKFIWYTILMEMASVGMISEDIKSNENDIHDPPDTTQTSSDQFKNTQKDVAEIETIHTYITPIIIHPIIINFLYMCLPKQPKKMERSKVKSQLRSDVHCKFTKSSSPSAGCS